MAILALSQVGNYPYSLQKLIEKSSNPLSLYAAASYLQFDYLKEQTLKFIKNSVSFENLFDVIQFACYYQLITELETPILDNLQSNEILTFLACYFTNPSFIFIF